MFKMPDDIGAVAAEKNPCLSGEVSSNGSKSAKQGF
jgi:hypothetical protein